MVQGTVSIQEIVLVLVLLPMIQQAHIQLILMEIFSNEDCCKATVTCGGGGYNGFVFSFGSGDGSTSFMSTSSVQLNCRGGDGGGGSVQDPLRACVIISGDN